MLFPTNTDGESWHYCDFYFPHVLPQDIDFDEDWKLLTILIGMNDICDYCKDKALLTKLFLWQTTDRRFFYSIDIVHNVKAETRGGLNKC